MFLLQPETLQYVEREVILCAYEGVCTWTCLCAPTHFALDFFGVHTRALDFIFGALGGV